jgi:hypothetical protein
MFFLLVKQSSQSCRLNVLLLSPTPILLSGIGRTCFSSCCDKDSAIIFTAACLTSSLLKTGVGANGCTMQPGPTG